MIIIWTILSTIGLLVAMWYLTSIFNPNGRLNYPMLLWKNSGHFISLAVIVVGIVSLVGLYASCNDLFLFLNILTGILILVFLVRLKYTPMKMAFNVGVFESMDGLYSEGGLQFYGFNTASFLDKTEELEKKQPGILERIIGEAHYLIFWLHRFPEIIFFVSIISYRNLWLSSALFIVAYVFELVRFYTFGSSLLLSNLCRFWNWIKAPLFITSSIMLWADDIFSSVVLLVFLVIQGWFDLIATIGMFPIRTLAAQIVYKKYGRDWSLIERVALNFVIWRWHRKLLPPTT